MTPELPDARDFGRLGLRIAAAVRVMDLVSAGIRERIV